MALTDRFFTHIFYFLQTKQVSAWPWRYRSRAPQCAQFAALGELGEEMLPIEPNKRLRRGDFGNE